MINSTNSWIVQKNLELELSMSGMSTLGKVAKKRDKKRGSVRPLQIGLRAHVEVQRQKMKV